MTEDNDFEIKRLIRGMRERGKVTRFDAVFELPKDLNSLLGFLEKHGKNNKLQLFVEGKDIKMRNISFSLRFLGIFNKIIYGLRSGSRKVKIVGVALTEDDFNRTHEDVLAKNIAIAIRGIRGPFIITNSLKKLSEWAKKVSLPKSEKYYLRLYLRGEYQGQRHYLQGIFASSEAGAEAVEKEKKSIFRKMVDIAILPIKIPFKIVWTVWKELVGLFIKSAEKGLFVVKIEKLSFEYKGKYITVGTSENALFKPELYIAEIIKSTKE